MDLFSTNKKILLRNKKTSLSPLDPALILRQQLLMPDQTGKDITLEYVSATSRYVWTPIVDRYWIRWTLDILSSGCWTLDASTVYDVIKGWSDRDASITYNPAWSQGSTYGTLNGTWSYTKIASRYAEFSVTPTSDGKIYVVIAKESSGGIANVTINGSTDLVNELPLVGPNRQLDTYSATEAKNSRVLIASGLSAGTYTVRVTATGTKNASSSDSYIFFEGYGVTTLSIDDPQIGLQFDRATIRQIGYSSSNSNEYAYSYKPNGASTYQWTGTNHLNEIISSVTWQDELGNDISVSAGDTKTHGTQVIITQTGTSRHSDTGTTDHANVVCKHTFNTQGLDVFHQHTWLSTAVFDLAYPAMWRLVEAASLRGHMAGERDVIYDFNHNDNVLYVNRKDRLMAMWNASYPWVAWVYLPDLETVNGWANSQIGIGVRDEDTATANKIYVQRVGGTQEVANATVAVGDIWKGTVQYRISYIANPETSVLLM